MKAALVYHADWGSVPGKRWAVRAVRDCGGWRALPPERAGAPETLLARLLDAAGAAPVVAGFDFPIGVPRGWAERVGVHSFRELLPELGRGAWKDFFTPAERPEQISSYRPFYPRRGDGTKRDQLEAGLGLAWDDLYRRCERRTTGRRAACALFWTLGGNQVGKGAITGWRDMLQPALGLAALWPFDGALDELVGSGRVVVAETYPAEFYGQIGLVGRKSAAADRARNAPVLREAAANVGLTLDPALDVALEDGFRTDDEFDAFVGLLGMLNVLLGRRSSGEPRTDDAVLRVEGWMLGQRESREHHGQALTPYPMSTGSSHG